MDHLLYEESVSQQYMFGWIYNKKFNLNRTDLINMEEGRTETHFETNKQHKSISKLTKT